jgi:putative flippase GtrA
MQQLIRYGIVGIASNLIIFLFYLVITNFGFSPKCAMTIAYFAGVVQSFIFNRDWTFCHTEKVSAAWVRYVTVYGIGYLFNFVFLMVFVDHMNLPHQWVQGAAIVMVAILLFFAQKLWVFPSVTQRNET